jgi:hypothetical protein
MIIKKMYCGFIVETSYMWLEMFVLQMAENKLQNTTINIQFTNRQKLASYDPLSFFDIKPSAPELKNQPGNWICLQFEWCGFKH